MASRSVGIAGTGLIGASVGLGLAAKGWNVAGWDPDDATMDEALAVGAIDSTAADLVSLAAGGLDLLVLAGPPRAVIDAVAHLDHPGLVMDVAGVKVPVVSASQLARFVGTHPMAGREVTGPGAASAGLFRGAAWIVATDDTGSEDVAEVEAVIASLGARPVRMTAEEHDEAVAAVSHLPQVLAAALLAEAAAHTTALDLAAGSFRDLTRVAVSAPEVWAQLLVANRDAVSADIRGIAARLGAIASLIDSQDHEALVETLAEAGRLRRKLAPAVMAVRVALADNPGELARVGKALEVSAVDVRDLQLRHAPHGGGGVLTLSVRPGEAETLRSALLDVGLLLAD